MARIGPKQGHRAAVLLRSVYRAEQVGVADGPAPVPWQPNSVYPPAGTLPLYPTLVKLTAPLLPWAVAFQVLVTAAPEGRISPAVQPFSGIARAAPRTVATTPPFH